jgi:hypothetical protein
MHQVTTDDQVLTNAHQTTVAHQLDLDEPGRLHVRSELLTSQRLEPLWEEAFSQARARDREADSGPWARALERLVVALDSTERMAADLHPELGRRDWSRRTPGGCTGRDTPVWPKADLVEAYLHS